MGFLTKKALDYPAQLWKLIRKLEFIYKDSLMSVLYRNKTTDALIRLMCVSLVPCNTIRFSISITLRVLFTRDNSRCILYR